MLTYEVVINGEKITLAGIADWTVMSVIVSAGRCDGGDDVNHTLDIGGMSRDREDGAHHVRWKAPEIGLGTEILIKILDSDQPDIPAKRYRSDSEVQENPFTEEEIREMRYRDYLEMKAEFEIGSD